jgi:hypothetical protein
MHGKTTFYDIAFVIHIVAALATYIVLISMRSAALLVANGADVERQKRRLPNRRNLAARIVHILPLTGFMMVFPSTKDVSIGKLWVLVGIFCYLAAVGHLEARTLPAERELAKALHENGNVAPAEGKRLVRSLDVVFLILTVAFVAMIVQF